MKKTILTIVLSTFHFFLFSQPSISPAVTNEFCPNTDIIFNITISGTAPSVSSSTNSPIVVQQPYDVQTNEVTKITTFKFKGKFRDVNVAQTFRLDYDDISGTRVSHDFVFKFIKSLFYQNPQPSSQSSPCKLITPNITTFDAPRCEIVSRTLSFEKVKWSTYGEGPDFCWGTIDNYEYLIPSGWQVDGKLSNGNDWIVDDNNVTISSNLASGVGGFILIRPASSCGAGLANGQTPKQISISRPEPVLKINSPDNFVICTGSSKIFSISGLPNGATVSWSVTNDNWATIVGSNTNPTVTVQGITNNSVLSLKATVTHCDFSYERSETIFVGTPRPQNLNASGYCSEPGCGRAGWVVIGCDAVPGATLYKWYVNDIYIGNSTVNYKSVPPPYECGGYYEYYVEAEGPCGLSLPSQPNGFTYTVCSGLRATIKGNPAKNVIMLSMPKSDKIERMNTEIMSCSLISTTTGLVVKRWKISSSQEQYYLNIQGIKPGLYILKIGNGKLSENHKVIIE